MTVAFITDRLSPCIEDLRSHIKDFNRATLRGTLTSDEEFFIARSPDHLCGTKLSRYVVFQYGRDDKDYELIYEMVTMAETRIR